VFVSTGGMNFDKEKPSGQKRRVLSNKKAKEKKSG